MIVLFKPLIDGAISIVIGLTFAGAAWVSAFETLGLLIGEVAAPEITEATLTIDALNEIRTLHREPNDVMLALSVDFEDNVPAGKVETVIFQLEIAIKQRYPVMKRLFIEVPSAKHNEKK